MVFAVLACGTFADELERRRKLKSKAAKASLPCSSSEDIIPFVSIA